MVAVRRSPRTRIRVKIRTRGVRRAKRKSPMIVRKAGMIRAVARRRTRNKRADWAYGYTCYLRPWMTGHDNNGRL